MEMVLCFRCGGELPADRQSCDYCAAPVITAAPPTPPAPVPPMAPAIVAAPSGKRRGTAVAAVFALFLVAGGIAVAATRLRGDSPRAAAEHYFEALTDGDAAAALGLVASAESIDISQYPLLSDKALYESRYRPRDVEVGDDIAAGTQFGTEARSLRVSYRAGGQTVNQDLVAVREDGHWRLRLPFVLLAVVGQRGREVSVNGVGLGGAERATAAFPGAYEAVAAGNKLLAESRAGAVAQAGGLVNYTAPLQFGVPDLAGGAQQAIQGQVRTALDQCAKSTRAQPAGCPFGLDVPGTNIAVHWTITTYPQVNVRTDSVMWFSGAAVQVVDDGTGRMHWSAGYTDYSGTRKSQSGDADFRINGNAQATPTGIQVSLT